MTDTIDYYYILLQGCLNPISLNIPEGTILSPSETAAVVGGNVLTSQRIVDVLLRAFSACAASQVRFDIFISINVIIII